MGREMLAASIVPRLPRGVRLIEDTTRGAWVLLAPERVVTVDAVSVDILQRVDGARSFGEIVSELAAAFDAPADEISADVGAFLIDLKDRQMMRLDGHDRAA
jgi:pyrroloquinoline quinone biosynthesis protein D